MTTTTDTSIDFAPLIELRAEYDQIADDLCRRIDADDPVAIGIGQQMLNREATIREALEAKLATMFRRDVDVWTDELLGNVVHFGFDATGDLCTHVDNVTTRRENRALTEAREQVAVTLSRHGIHQVVLDELLAAFDRWIDSGETVTA